MTYIASYYITGVRTDNVSTLYIVQEESMAPPTPHIQRVSIQRNKMVLPVDSKVGSGTAGSQK